MPAKGAYAPLYAVSLRVRYAVSYLHLGEISAECGVTVDPATLNRWIVRYSPF